MEVGSPTGGGGTGVAPTAEIFYTPGIPFQGTTVSFASIGPGTAPLTYSWTFGAQQVSTQAGFSYYFSGFGNVVVGLTVTNQYGSNTATETIYINPQGGP
jgi:PKD repeat protein